MVIYYRLTNLSSQQILIFHFRSECWVYRVGLGSKCPLIRYLDPIPTVARRVRIDLRSSYAWTWRRNYRHLQIWWSKHSRSENTPRTRFDSASNLHFLKNKILGYTNVLNFKSEDGTNGGWNWWVSETAKAKAHSEWEKNPEVATISGNWHFPCLYPICIN